MNHRRLTNRRNRGVQLTVRRQSERIVVLGMLYSSIGLGFFVYGKRQRAVVPLVCGLALMVFPYFVSNIILLVVIGAVLIAVPYFVRY